MSEKVEIVVSTTGESNESIASVLKKPIDKDSVIVETNNNNPTTANVIPVKTNSKTMPTDTVFTLKRWNLVAMWSWDVECEVCAICRTPLMDPCLKCQTDNKNEDCVVVWGECNHSFHNCCMLQWIKNRNLCPLCQTEWRVSRVGR